MKCDPSRRGFTLVELMVVMSIFSILASVVLVSLNSTRYKGKNAKVQSEVINLRSQIETSWDGNKYELLQTTPPGPSGYGLALLDPLHLSFYPSATPALSIISDIITIVSTPSNALTGYGGGYTPGTACWNYCINMGYPVGTCSGVSGNFISVFTNNPAPPDCTLTYATKYAIYAPFVPSVGNSGYFCADSSGNTSKSTNGGIPDSPGPGPSCN